MVHNYCIYRYRGEAVFINIYYRLKNEFTSVHAILKYGKDNVYSKYICKLITINVYLISTRKYPTAVNRLEMQKINE